MFWFKRCPRCSGDLFEDRDTYGPFITCMQCGFTKDVMSKLDEPLEKSLEPVPVPTVPKSDGIKRRRMSHGGRHTIHTFAQKGLADKFVA